MVVVSFPGSDPEASAGAQGPSRIPLGVWEAGAAYRAVDDDVDAFAGQVGSVGEVVVSVDRTEQRSGDCGVVEFDRERQQPVRDQFRGQRDVVAQNQGGVVELVAGDGVDSGGDQLRTGRRGGPAVGEQGAVSGAGEGVGVARGEHPEQVRAGDRECRRRPEGDLGGHGRGTYRASRLSRSNGPAWFSTQKTSPPAAMRRSIQAVAAARSVNRRSHAALPATEVVGCSPKSGRYLTTMAAGVMGQGP